MFKSREKGLGDYLQKKPKNEGAEKPQIESFRDGAKKLQETGAQRRLAAIETGTRMWENTKGFLSRFVKRSAEVGLKTVDTALAAPEAVRLGARVTKEAVKSGAEFVSKKTQEVHSKGVEKLSKVVDGVNERKDKAIMRLDDGIDVGMKYYEAKQNQFTEWKTKRAMGRAEIQKQERKATLTEKVMTLEKQVSELKKQLAEI